MISLNQVQSTLPQARKPDRILARDDFVIPAVDDLGTRGRYHRFLGWIARNAQGRGEQEHAVGAKPLCRLGSNPPMLQPDGGAAVCE
jgi:hypothetical protein